MRVRTPRRSTAAPRRAQGASHEARVRSEAPPPPVEARDAAAPRRPRAGGGPSQDRALYTCACGYLFEAPVSASVRCPSCGGEQAW